MNRPKTFPLKSQRFLALLAIWLILVWTSEGHAQELSKLPYVPTPQIVVDEMLKLASVNAKDFVIDLGSGDGRMIITAGRNFKASGLGVDIDARLVDLANKQAKTAGVDGHVRFVQQDMFKTDVSPATVVTLYVLPDFMEKLRPKLLSELKPGSRIVAHDYHMSGWYPDRQITLTVPEKVEANGTDKAYIYLWIVPSVVAGDWRMDFTPPGSVPPPTALSFNQQYQMLSGSAASKGGLLKIDNPILNGSDIEFFVTLGPNYYRFTGKIDGDKMEGTAATSTGGKPLPWRASKVTQQKN
ncbi:MAG TPA: class I SAM-dependent methyltransferase [Candidatus Limnocylindria bacterium]|nr:class I SAM-dependent methyltransferase [Candidatus Limnocylindria bacterium]